MNSGTLFIISAPSGAGKSSLINAYLAQKNQQESQLSISHTTREPRLGEQHGKHYYFTNQETFEQLIEQNVFVEHAKVFDNYYGTSKAMIEEKLKNGINLFLDIDWQGARQVKQKIPTAKTIFILPPSLPQLRERLIKRGQDSEEVIEKRMQKATSEMSHYHEYDYLIINDSFDKALNALSSIIYANSLQTDKQLAQHAPIIKTLIS